MTPEAIYEKLKTDLGEDVALEFHPVSDKARDAWVSIAPYEIERVCEYLKTTPGLSFDYLECITGVDYPDLQKIVVVYHVYSYTARHRIVLKVFLDRGDPAMPSVVNVWSTANWQERECYDLLGVLFEGHPDLRRLLLPDDWEGHPLRKDFEEKEEYHGIPTVRPNPIELYKIQIPGKEAKAS